MSTMFWNALKLSPALLGASLLFVSSTQAQGSVPSQAAAVNNSQVAVTVEPKAEALTQLPQTTAIATVNTNQVTATTSQATAIEETSVSPLTASDASQGLNQTNKLLAQQVPASSLLV